MTLALSADLGTEGVRVAAYDLTMRESLADASRPYPTTFLPGARAEQNPESWWTAFLDAADEVLTTVRRRDVMAMCVAATSSTVVACTRQGAPLRPAIMWMDARAGEESERTARSQHPVLRYSGGSDAVEWLVPKAMWLKDHEPDVYASADVVAEQVDFLNHRLTGRWAGSRLNATCKWNLDPDTDGFHPELFDELGVPDLLGKLPSDIVAVGEIIGEATGVVVNRLRLTRPPVVVQGGIDAHMAMLGGGTLSDGDLLIIGGSSVVHLAHSRAPSFSPGIWGPYPDALVKGWSIVEGGQVSGGSILKWLVNDIFGLDESSHAELANAAAGRPAGHLLALDHWMGNRTPYRDPWMRGAIIGLTLGHDRVDIYRACVEAIALGTRNVVAAFDAAGVGVRRGVVAGGIRNNPLWLQLTADALGMELGLTADANLSLVAGAVAASTALGLSSDLLSASAAWVRIDDVVAPDMAAHKRLDSVFEDYLAAIEGLHAPVHNLAHRQQGSDVN